MESPLTPLSFTRGPGLVNRMMLAPMTNTQSHADGTLSAEERLWLTMRAKGGFGGVMTAAAFVAPEGKGFTGQLGVHDDRCIEPLRLLTDAVRKEGCPSYVQLHHAGMRATQSETGLPAIAPSAVADWNAREMTVAEIQGAIEAYVRGAERAEQAGFDGVEIHGAHTYLIAEFLSAEYNRREDDWGGSLDNRARFLRAIIDGVRTRCGRDFTVGLRLSGERMGMRMGEVLSLCEELCAEGKLDFLELSLWDAFKDPEEDQYKGRPLFQWFADLERGDTRLGIAGRIRSGANIRTLLDAGIDFALIGYAGILNHDFPRRLGSDPEFRMPPLPTTPAHLAAEGLSPAFISYLRTDFQGFMDQILD